MFREQFQQMGPPRSVWSARIVLYDKLAIFQGWVVDISTAQEEGSVAAGKYRVNLVSRERENNEFAPAGLGTRTD